eukprot:3011230-Amphidinium_carterae.2
MPVVIVFLFSVEYILARSDHQNHSENGNCEQVTLRRKNIQFVTVLCIVVSLEFFSGVNENQHQKTNVVPEGAASDVLQSSCKINRHRRCTTATRPGQTTRPAKDGTSVHVLVDSYYRPKGQCTDDILGHPGLLAEHLLSQDVCGLGTSPVQQRALICLPLMAIDCAWRREQTALYVATPLRRNLAVPRRNFASLVFWPLS